MNMKLILFCVCLLSCIFLISSVSASDVNGDVAVDNVSQIEIIGDNVGIDDVVCDDSVGSYDGSQVQSRVNDPVLMGQSVSSVNNGDVGSQVSTRQSSSPMIVNVRPSLSVDTYNVLADNETSKKVKFDVTCSQPIGYKTVSVEAYKDNKLVAKNSGVGHSTYLELPEGLYKVVFKSEYPNLSKVVYNISVTDGKSFYDLNRIVNAGRSEAVLDRDYAYNPLLDKAFKKGIVIGKPIAINGNGHLIDANNKCRIFDVVSDGVSISNITLANGYVVDCGGALLWEADNGVISNVHFVNDTSLHVGGAIALDGKNILLDSLQFENSTAGWTKDLIYLGHNFENATIMSCSSEDMNRIADGRKVNLSLSGAPIPMKVLGCPVDMSKYVFDVLAIGGNHTLVVNSTSVTLEGKTIKTLKANVLNKTRTITYFGKVVNGTDFMLTFFEHLDDVYIIEDFTFTGVGNASELIGDTVLNRMRNGQFNVTFTYLKYATIKDNVEYENTLSLKAKDVFGDSLDYYSQGLKDFGKDHVSCIKGLGVNFAKTLNIDSHSTWCPKKMGFDSVVINGNNSVINGNSKKRNSHKWADIDEGYVLTASDITIKRFNNAFVNDLGICILNHVLVTKNKMKYLVDRDWGAGLLNAGWSICTDCNFTDNYCSHGGAIFNQGVLTLNNCSFKGNDAYRKGNTVLNVDDAEVYLDGVQINGSSGPIKHISSISSGLEKFLKSFAVIGSFILGGAAGAATNPAAGALIGAGVGVVVGGLTSWYITSHHYDIHYNRLKATLILTGMCAVAGAAGGLIGGYAAQYSASPNNFGGMVEEQFSTYASTESNLPQYQLNIWGEGFKEAIHGVPNIIDGFIA